ncbi:unnamed protein product, partial [Polarella glacialis]
DLDGSPPHDAGPPLRPKRLTAGLPDPNLVKHHREAYMQKIDGQLQEGISLLKERCEAQKQELRRVCQQRKQEYKHEVDRQFQEQANVEVDKQFHKLTDLERVVKDQREFIQARYGGVDQGSLTQVRDVLARREFASQVGLLKPVQGAPNSHAQNFLASTSRPPSPGGSFRTRVPSYPLLPTATHCYKQDLHDPSPTLRLRHIELGLDDDDDISLGAISRRPTSPMQLQRSSLMHEEKLLP